MLSFLRSGDHVANIGGRGWKSLGRSLDSSSDYLIAAPHLWRPGTAQLTQYSGDKKGTPVAKRPAPMHAYKSSMVRGDRIAPR